MFRKMNNQQVYQSLFPTTNIGLLNQLKPVENHEITITNNIEFDENEPKNREDKRCCDETCEDCKCDNDTKCRCKQIKDFLERLESKY